MTSAKPRTKIAITLAGLAKIWKRTPAVASTQTRDCRLSSALPGSIDFEAALFRRPVEVSKAEFEAIVALEAHALDGSSVIAATRDLRLYDRAIERKAEITAACRPGGAGGTPASARAALQSDQAERLRRQLAAADLALQAERLRTGDAAAALAGRLGPMVVARFGGIPAEVEAVARAAGVEPAVADRLREAARRAISSGIRLLKDDIRAELLGEEVDVSMR
jgi:hypothetical protein